MPLRYGPAMELRHLRSFLAVAKYGTVTSAANHLHVAQPAISRQLRRLEADLHLTLFERSGPRLTLTRAGREMQVVAMDIVIRADRGAMFAHQIASGRLAHVKIAAGPTTTLSVLAPFVATLSETDPEVSVDAMPPDVVQEAVLAGHDLGLSTAAAPSGALHWRLLERVPLRAYVRPGHPWDGREVVELSELSSTTLIVPPAGSPVRSRMDAAMMLEDLDARQLVVQSEPAIRKALAAAGRGVAIAGGEPEYGTVSVPVVDHTGGTVAVSTHACWSPDHYGSDAIGRFVDQLAEFVEKTSWKDSADTAGS